MHVWVGYDGQSKKAGGDASSCGADFEAQDSPALTQCGSVEPSSGGDLLPSDVDLL